MRLLSNISWDCWQAWPFRTVGLVQKVLRVFWLREQETSQCLVSSTMWSLSWKLQRRQRSVPRTLIYIDPLTLKRALRSEPHAQTPLSQAGAHRVLTSLQSLTRELRQCSGQGKFHQSMTMLLATAVGLSALT
jgi:hypothetical protein